MCFGDSSQCTLITNLMANGSNSNDLQSCLTSQANIDMADVLSQRISDNTLWMQQSVELILNNSTALVGIPPEAVATLQSMLPIFTSLAHSQLSEIQFIKDNAEKDLSCERFFGERVNMTSLTQQSPDCFQGLNSSVVQIDPTLLTINIELNNDDILMQEVFSGNFTEIMSQLGGSAPNPNVNDPFNNQNGQDGLSPLGTNPFSNPFSSPIFLGSSDSNEDETGAQN